MLFNLCLLSAFAFACLLSTTTGIAFESCGEAQYKGNCTTITGDGAIGSESVGSIKISNGSFDYGYGWGGCPFKNNTCPTGFSYYGWTKFFNYPTPCDAFGVLISTEVFNIHLLGNGHLAAYAWLPNGTEYYAEAVEPILLGFWTPIIVNFEFISSNNTFRLYMIVQGQLVAGALTGRPRTYKPPSGNLLFAGNGVNSTNSLTLQLDRIIPDGTVRDVPYMFGFLINIPARQSNCQWRTSGLLTQPLSCIYVTPAPQNWTNAYKACVVDKYNYGYADGRLAWFPSWNTSKWEAFKTKLALYSNGTLNGQTFWIGGGQNLQWLNRNMTKVNQAAVVPTGVTSNTSTSTATTCLALNTKTKPWQWYEESCSVSKQFICEMTYDCLTSNPCKNLGTCQPINDGYNICKCWPGTSGQFCETGSIRPNCVNNCPCPIPDAYKPPTNNTGNCSACMDAMASILNDLSSQSAALKSLMTIVGAELDDVDALTCNLTSKYETMVSNILSKVAGANIDCSLIWQYFSEILFNVRIMQIYNKTALTVLDSLPDELTTSFQNILKNQTNLMNLPCFGQFIKPLLTQPTQKDLFDFCSKDHIVEDLAWIAYRKTISVKKRLCDDYMTERKRSVHSNNGNHFGWYKDIDKIKAKSKVLKLKSDDNNNKSGEKKNNKSGEKKDKSNNGSDKRDKSNNGNKSGNKSGKH